MKISSSDILFTSQHASAEKHSVRESMRVWGGGPRRPAFDTVSLSEQGKSAQKTDAAAELQEAIKNDPRLQLLISMIEALTGKKIRSLSVKDLQTPSDRESTAPKPCANTRTQCRLWNRI